MYLETSKPAWITPSPPPISPPPFPTLSKPSPTPSNGSKKIRSSSLPYFQEYSDSSPYSPLRPLPLCVKFSFSFNFEIPAHPKTKRRRTCASLFSESNGQQRSAIGHRLASHRQHHAKLRLPRHHPRIRFIRFRQRILLDHRPHSGHLRKPQRVLRIHRRSRWPPLHAAFPHDQRRQRHFQRLSRHPNRQQFPARLQSAYQPGHRLRALHIFRRSQLLCQHFILRPAPNSHHAVSELRAKLNSQMTQSPDPLHRHQIPRPRTAVP